MLGRAIQSAIVVGGGRGGGGGRRVGGRCTVKATNYKRWGWDQPSDVRMLFKGDPARPGHALHVETSNKQAECMLKIRCRICRTLISYHNNSWTCVATHIQSHDIATTQDIVAANDLACESEANGKPFPIHKLPPPLAVKKEAARDATLMQHNFAAPSYRPDT